MSHGGTRGGLYSDCAREKQTAHDELTRDDDIKAVHCLKQCWPGLASSLQYVVPAALSIWTLQHHMLDSPVPFMINL